MKEELLSVELNKDETELIAKLAIKKNFCLYDFNHADNNEEQLTLYVNVPNKTISKHKDTWPIQKLSFVEIYSFFQKYEDETPTIEEQLEYLVEKPVEIVYEHRDCLYSHKLKKKYGYYQTNIYCFHATDVKEVVLEEGKNIICLKRSHRNVY